MRFILTLLFLIVLPARAEEPLNSFVYHIASEFSDGYAVPVQKAIRYKELKNGRYLATFTLEGFAGGNNEKTFLALISDSSGTGAPFPAKKRWGLVDTLKVEEPGWRLFDFDSLKQKSASDFVFTTRSYNKGDAMCCPSVQGSVEIMVDNDTLLEKAKANR